MNKLTKKREWRKYVFLVGLGFIALLAVTGSLDTKLEEQQQVDEIQQMSDRFTLRHLTSANCTPSSADEFPEDLFTLEQRRNGAIIIHLLVALYMFAALGIVCDDYFVESLELISDALSLTPDVAGATFMAAGSSAPELFTALIGVFIAKSDVGVGTIVGSAVFNILCIVAICGIFAGATIQLTWWPIVRDTVFYMFSVLALIYVMFDEEVLWYEGLFLVLMYLVYVIIMCFNSRLEKLVKQGCGRQQTEEETEPLVSGRMFSADEKTTKLSLRGSGEESTEELEESHETFRRSTSRLNVSEIPESDAEEVESPFTPPDSTLGKVYWALMLPMQVLFVLTIPDCRKSGCWRKLYAVTFTMSIVWIGVCSYIMVWMVVVFGATLGVPDTVMGLTLLAAGTSVPDALAGLFVARDGYGDMAICNAVGSNVFDILICLGLPWLLRTLTGADIIPINSSGLLYSALTLVSTVFILLIFLSLCKWRLTVKSGLVFFLLYVIVITFSCLYELNIFGEFNPPPCD